MIGSYGKALLNPPRNSNNKAQIPYPLVETETRKGIINTEQNVLHIADVISRYAFRSESQKHYVNKTETLKNNKTRQKLAA